MKPYPPPRALAALVFSFCFLSSALVAQTNPPSASPSYAAVLLVEQGESRLEENQIDEARELFRKALQTDQKNTKAEKHLRAIEAGTVRRAAPVAVAAAATPYPSTTQTAPSSPTATPIAGASPATSTTSSASPAVGIHPTNNGGKGGATPATADMPMDEASLIALRKTQLGKPEYRAAWITRMDWASPDQTITRNKIVTLLDRAKEINLNTVFFQVRGDCTTLYPSELEPVSDLLGGRLDWDPMAFAIEEAHKRSIEFHAYFNISTASEKRDGPSNPNHIFQQHCLDGSNPNWLVYKDGAPLGFEEYWWLNTNLPEVQAHVRRAAVDFVHRYNVDGIHYDRVRFPSGATSDDPWSKARFQTTNPNNLDYNAWQRENLAQLLTDIYAAAVTMRPNIRVSGAVWGIYDKTKLPAGADRSVGYSWTSSGLQDYHQDSIDWINRGCMDMLVPMIYWNMGEDKPDYDEVLASFVSLTKSGRHVIGGQRVFDPVEMLRETAASILVGAQGSCPFTLNRLYDTEANTLYKTAIYPDRVEIPAMPWRTNPETGIVLVVVRDAQGVPVMNAPVRIAGDKPQLTFSSADGFCSFISAPLGKEITITAEKPGAPGVAVTKNLTIEKGKSADIELKFN